MTVVTSNRENRRIDAEPNDNSLPDELHDSNRLGDQLLKANLVSAKDLEAAFAGNKRGLKVGELLLDVGLLSEDQLLPFMGRQMGTPTVRLRDGLVDPIAARRIPQPVSKRLNAVALFEVHGTLTVAMDDPRDLVTLDEIEQITGLQVRPVFAFKDAIHRIIDRCYQDDFEVDTVTADMDESAVEINAETSAVDFSSVEQLVNGSPIINLVNYLILQAIQKSASDIHIEPGRRFSQVRFRVDGQLQEMLRPRRDIHPAIVSRIKVMSKMDIAEHHLPQDGRCQVTVDKKEIDLRVSSLPTVNGEKIVIRVLDRGRLTFNLETLGLASDQLADLKEILNRPYGLMLATGPTGSGKSTTLYSALELIKSVHRNIITVEDPVEYQIDQINQVQVDKARGLEFASVLRSILRQDPDVIMVGEIRDSETAHVAVQAALTGHLVISTLHTNDAHGAITRLIDMEVEPYKIAAALQGVIGQRLVRKVCPKCKMHYHPSKETFDLINYQGDHRKRFLKGEGCRECYDSGYQGRLGIYEVVAVDTTLRQLISNGASQSAMRDDFLSRGGKTLFDSGIHLAEKELTSLEEVTRVAITG